MKKIKYLTALIIAMLFIKEGIHAQMLSPFVIASSGGFSSHPLGTFSFTVGEMTMVETFHVNNFLTQGFQQPVPDQIEGIETASNDHNELKIFPNPATDQLYVAIPTQYDKVFCIRITDIVGQKILSWTCSRQLSESPYSLNIRSLSQGIYILTIESSEKAFSNTIRFIKK
jgi:hypothetical protein